MKKAISKKQSQQASGLSKKTSSRGVAVRIVQDCVQSGQSLSGLLPRYLEQLPPDSRPLAQEISFGVLRWYYRLHCLLNNMLSKPLRGKKQSVHFILLTGLYQLIYLDKADYAAVTETVNVCDELKQSWAKGLVNAILRRFLREKEVLTKVLEQSYSSRFAYPEWLINALKKSWKNHHSGLEVLLDAGNQRPPMTLRVNQKLDIEAYIAQLETQHISCSRPSAEDCFSHTLILDKPVSVEKIPCFAQGDVSVQDGAPQLAAHLLAPQPGERVLDACAAPGGKTMHLFEQQPLIAQVIALDVSAERLQRVAENAQRLHIPEQKLTMIAADASAQDWWDGQLFDRILLDAPCSATGVIRRHPDIKVLRREEDIAALTQLQSAILDNLWQLLKPGGLLLYATCSVIREENDQQIAAFIQRQQEQKPVEEIVINADWGEAMPRGRQIFPGSQNLDGFYYALLRKGVAEKNAMKIPGQDAGSK